MRKLKMQIVALALTFAAAVAAKIYVDKLLAGQSRQAVVSETPGAVSLPEPEKKM